MVQQARIRPFPKSQFDPERHPLLRGTLGDSLRAQLELRRVEAGVELVGEGEIPTRVLFLLAGTLRAGVSADDGREALTRIVAAPGLLGSMEAVTETASPISLRTLEVSHLGILPVAPWRRAVAIDAELHRRWLLMLAQDRRETLGRHRSALFDGLEGRLAALLLELLERYGLPVPGGRRIRIRLRHEDLADALGAARRSVTRVLTEWRSLGWIRHESGSFIVTQISALEARALRR